MSGVRLKTIGSGLDECISSGEKKGDDKVNAKNEGRPLRYMAPETLATPPVFSDKSDVWAFGVLIWEVLDGCEASVPYGDVVDDDAVVTGVVRGSLKLSRPKKASKALWRVAQRCMQQDPSERPSFQDVSKMLDDLRATIQ